MKYDFIYDSRTMFGEKAYTFKEEHSDSSIVPVCVFFEKEKVYLAAYEDGSVVFSDENGTELYRTKAEGQGHCFFEFDCAVKDGVISVKFPIQEVVDHYPHCDGEYDRYSYITKDTVVIEYTL